MDQEQPPRSLFRKVFRWLLVGILVCLAVNEFSHLYRTPESISIHHGLYERHYNLTSRFPFIGSYFLMPPEGYDPSRRYPAVVVLQGISKRIYAAEYLAQEDYRRRYPAFVIVPVPPPRAFWIQPRDKDYSMPQPIPFPDHMPQTIDMIDAVAADYSLDRQRIYITGHSMGGMGVIGALQAYPDMFAAGLALSSSWNPAETDKIRSPLWLIHGGADTQIPASFSRLIAGRLRARRADVRYDELKGQGHDIWSIVYTREQIWDWLFSQKGRVR